MNAGLNHWLRHIEAQHPRSVALGLERLARVGKRMELTTPQHRLLVAGTNGKGSVCAALDNLCRAGGHCTGRYTSPHLRHYRERVVIDGQPVDDEALVASFAAVEAARGDVPLTYFEFGTLAAVWLFRRAGVTVEILEVGLGGRLDAVNLFEPDVSVITTVDLDHQDWLGPDRESIGREKAGILRPGRVGVLGEADPPASVLETAARLQAPLRRAGHHFHHRIHDDGRWTWHGYDRCCVDLPPPGIPGRQQYANAATALATCEAAGLLPEDEDTLRQAVAATRLPGRLEERHCAGVTWLLDVAHNPQAMTALARELVARPASGRTMAVLAMLGDKDARASVAPLQPWVDAWFLAGLDGPRGLSAGNLVRVAGLDQERVSLHADVAGACRQAWGQAGEGDRIVVSGSFLTVAQALDHLENACDGARQRSH